MRIGTWNVDYAEPPHVNLLRKVIAEHPADIWVLTETNDELRPPNAPHRLSSRPRSSAEAAKSREGSHWVTIWSRFPILELTDFVPSDQVYTAVARVDLSELGSGKEAIIFGTVLPWQRGEDHSRAIRQQSAEWRTLVGRFPNALFCLAGDFNTDMGRASEYGLRYFVGSKPSTEQLSSLLRDVGLSCVTDHGYPKGLRPNYPPVDHIALSEAVAARTRIASVWAGKHGDGVAAGDRIGLVVDVPKDALP